MNSKDIRHAIRSAALTVTLVVMCALPAGADYDAGKRAWDAGKPTEAVAQWQAAADAGDRRAMLALGRLYLQGLGALQDYVLAHMWFNLAASRGEMEALKERDAVMGKMTPQQVAEAQKRAREWRPGSGEAGEPKPASASKPASPDKAAATPSRPVAGSAASPCNSGGTGVIDGVGLQTGRGGRQMGRA